MFIIKLFKSIISKLFRSTATVTTKIAQQEITPILEEPSAITKEISWFTRANNLVAECYIDPPKVDSSNFNQGADYTPELEKDELLRYDVEFLKNDKNYAAPKKVITNTHNLVLYATVKDAEGNYKDCWDATKEEIENNNSKK